MKKIARGNKIVAAVVMLAALALLVAGVWGLTLRGGDFAGLKLTQMRTHAVMRVAAEGIIDEIALQAKKRRAPLRMPTNTAATRRRPTRLNRRLWPARMPSSALPNLRAWIPMPW